MIRRFVGYKIYGLKLFDFSGDETARNHKEQE